MWCEASRGEEEGVSWKAGRGLVGHAKEFGSGLTDGVVEVLGPRDII